MLIIQLDGKAREFVAECCNLASKCMNLDLQSGKLCIDHYRKGMVDIIEIQRLTLIDGPISLRNDLLAMLTTCIDLMIDQTQRSMNAGFITPDEAEMVCQLALRVANACEAGEEIF